MIRVLPLAPAISAFRPGCRPPVARYGSALRARDSTSLQYLRALRLRSLGLWFVVSQPLHHGAPVLRCESGPSSKARPLHRLQNPAGLRAAETPAVGIGCNLAIEVGDALIGDRP